MNKLEQAARHLLEVADGIQHGTDWNNGTHAKIYRPKFPAAITALREALAEQAEQEPVAWMWACTECGTEAEDGTDCRICSSCGYHKFYKAPKVATCVCAAKTQEQAEQEPVATHICNLWVDPITKEYVVDHCDHPIDELIPAYAAPVQQAEQEPVPTGATHYQPHQKTYYKRVSATEWYLWSCTGKGWLPSKGTSDSSEWIMLSPIQAHQPAKPAEQEPVAWRAKDANGKWMYGDLPAPELPFDQPKQLYAAPVRTKDLTDGEKFLLIEAYEIQKYKWTAMDFVDAVIAADRKLNGVEK